MATVVKASGGAGDRRSEFAEIKIAPSGRITAYTGISPHGQGTETSFAQIVARELGVSPSEVQVLHSDTAISTHGSGTVASRGTVAGGSALQVVVQEARSKLSQIASHLMKCPAEDVTFQNGRVTNSGDPGQTLDLSEVVAAAFDEELLPPGLRVGLDFSGNFTLPSNPYAFGAHVVVVEVNKDTGQ